MYDYLLSLSTLTKEQSENENKIRMDNRCLHFAQKLFLLKVRNYFPKIPYVYVSDLLIVLPFLKHNFNPLVNCTPLI